MAHNEANISELYGRFVKRERVTVFQKSRFRCRKPRMNGDGLVVFFRQFIKRRQSVIVYIKTVI